MPASILGMRTEFSIDTITVDQAADFFRKNFSNLWRQVYTKHIDAPGNYYNFKLPAVTICAAIAESKLNKSAIASMNIAYSSAVQAKWDFPTFYVSAELLKSLQHTHPPTNMKWKDVARPFDGMIFMLPKGAIKEPSGKEVNFIGFAYFETAMADGPGVVIYYGVDSGLQLQSFGCAADKELEPEVGWINSRTEYWDATRPPEEHDKIARPPAEFLSYLSGLTANLLLLMTARPELVEPKHTGPRKWLAKQNVESVPARFIGRKYEVRREQPTVDAAGHFTKLIWRAGHFRIQHHGAKNEQTKTIWIDPYICNGAGLVIGETK
jgi:hypothetical protein